MKLISERNAQTYYDQAKILEIHFLIFPMQVDLTQDLK